MIKKSIQFGNKESHFEANNSKAIRQTWSLTTLKGLFVLLKFVLL